MEQNIFADNAPAYWSAGFSPIPLRGKRPVVPNWTAYENEIPNVHAQSEWLKKYAASGIGILTGTMTSKDFSFIAFDVDDDRLVPVVESMLGLTVCGKRGKKGITIFCLIQSKKSQTTTYKGKGGLGNIDILHHGRQTVIPPTIHPETGKPYEWVGVPLLELGVSALPKVPHRKLEVLKAAVESEHLPEIMAGRATNEPALIFVAQLVQAGAEAEEIHAIVRGALPRDYSGNTLDELNGMIQGARDKGFDQNSKPSAPKQSEEILEALSELNYELFKNQGSTSFISVPGPNGGWEHHPVRSSRSKQFLNRAYYEFSGKPPSSAARAEALDHLDTVAQIDGDVIETFIRIAGHEGKVYVDLANEKNEAVEISAIGWRIVQNPPVKFIRPGGNTLGLPTPRSEFDPKELRILLGMS